MLVKKKNPEWKPSENPNMQVGDLVDITDPKALILNGDVAAIDPTTHAEISPYELYGVVVKDELAEFKEYIALKKQQSLMEELKKEQETLQAQLDEAKAPADSLITVSDPVVTPELTTQQKRQAALAKARAAKKNK